MKLINLMEIDFFFINNVSIVYILLFIVDKRIFILNVK